LSMEHCSCCCRHIHISLPHTMTALENMRSDDQECTCVCVCVCVCVYSCVSFISFPQELNLWDIHLCECVSVCVYSCVSFLSSPQCTLIRFVVFFSFSFFLSLF